MNAYTSVRFFIGLASPSDPRATLAEERRRHALGILTANYRSFTVVDACGYWQGEPEPCLMVETVVALPNAIQDAVNGRPGEYARARQVAARVAVALDQTYVGLVFQPVSFDLVAPIDLDAADPLSVDLPTSTDLESLAGRYAPIGGGQ